MRQFPSRYYLKSYKYANSVGVKGEYIAEMLSTEPERVSLLNDWFDKLKINYKLDIKEITENDISIYFINLHDSNTNASVTPADVGFGISQVMPIIIQTISSRNKLILIEQPEIHLHPKLQAELADLFIRGAKGPDKNTFILETHSENLLLRIMRRIRETKYGTLKDQSLALTSDDVALLYVQPSDDGSGSIIIEMELDEEGRLLDPWPGGFFEDGFRERFGHE